MISSSSEHGVTTLKDVSKPRRLPKFHSRGEQQHGLRMNKTFINTARAVITQLHLGTATRNLANQSGCVGKQANAVAFGRYCCNTTDWKAWKTDTTCWQDLCHATAFNERGSESNTYSWREKQTTCPRAKQEVRASFLVFWMAASCNVGWNAPGSSNQIRVD